MADVHVMPCGFGWDGFPWMASLVQSRSSSDPGRGGADAPRPASGPACEGHTWEGSPDGWRRRCRAPPSFGPCAKRLAVTSRRWRNSARKPSDSLRWQDRSPNLADS